MPLHLAGLSKQSAEAIVEEIVEKCKASVFLRK
jgi:hypothetical protein